MSSVIITGGAGFIGSALARRLLDRGDEVVILDNLSTGSEANIPKGASFIMGDVSNPASLARLPAAPSAVFHLAAQSSGEASFDDPLVDFRTNVGGTFLLLQWSMANGARRFVYTSSMSVYGEHAGPGPVVETDQPMPRSYYGAAKLASEVYVGLFNRLGLETTVFRPFSVYGPGQNMANRKQGMVSIYLSYLLEDAPLVVKGERDRFRDHVNVADVVDAFLLSLASESACGQTYNLGTGIGTSVGTLIEKLLRYTGKKADYPVVQAGPTPGDTRGCVADIGRIKRDLGWIPRTPLDQGLLEMIGFHMKNGA